MRITHLGHSSVLVEVADQRILIDPGAYSTAWHPLTDLDAILITHSHPDHVDPDWAPALVKANPQAKLLVEPGIPDVVPLVGATGFHAGEKLTLGKVTIEGVGGMHAVIHRDIPRIGNVGMVISAPDEPRFYHTGDEIDTVPEGIDVAAVPAHAPWCAMKELIDFARALHAPQGFLIHDGMLNERGWEMSFSRLNEMTPTAFTDLRDGTPLSL